MRMCLSLLTASIGGGLPRSMTLSALNFSIMEEVLSGYHSIGGASISERLNFIA